ncbi:hypothetical protein HNR00_003544 [Methylorubrum rhodinum]|uniref:Uncharacterized protein n=1 Tax=Methylorubrum rhodinum TaxID=29428 RepID=A0A840ZPL9_9HYPH|nr:hypothetical protein [Methylorubrum rhodinum]MBB5758817.1 hypothetical protein [Methylorubrum rhodinum]
MSNKSIDWRAARSQMRNGRKPMPEVREERLRTMVGLRGSPAVALSAWRGRSGRRYVVGVHTIGFADAIDAVPAVLIAVSRNASGIAEPMDARNVPTREAAETWISAAREAGATEIHVHRLAEGDDERDALVNDLLLPATETEAA